MQCCCQRVAGERRCRSCSSARAPAARRLPGRADAAARGLALAARGGPDPSPPGLTLVDLRAAARAGARLRLSARRRQRDAARHRPALRRGAAAARLPVRHRRLRVRRPARPASTRAATTSPICSPTSCRSSRPSSIGVPLLRAAGRPGSAADGAGGAVRRRAAGRLRAVHLPDRRLLRNGFDPRVARRRARSTPPSRSPAGAATTCSPRGSAVQRRGRRDAQATPLGLGASFLVGGVLAVLTYAAGGACARVSPPEHRAVEAEQPRL